jgi:TrmH family RNA methyltransferase
LRLRKHRDDAGVFFVEGIAPVRAAIEHGADIETLLVSGELLTSAAANEVVAEQEKRGVAVARLSSDAFGSIAERAHPSGLAAVVRTPRTTLADLVVHDRALFAAVDSAGNPGNLGAIIRTIDAVGGDGVVTVGRGTDPFHPTAVKATMGTLFTVPVASAHGTDEVIEWCADHDVTLVTTSARAPIDFRTADYRLPVLVLFGNEATGLPPAVIERGDIAVRIPMAGAVSSLNLAVAAGILLYEVDRQRGVQ